MNHTDILTAMWQGAELVGTTHWGKLVSCELQKVGGDKLAVPIEVIGKISRQKLILRTSEYFGPNLCRFVITDAGLAEIGKPTAKEMKQMSVFHRKESEA